MNWQLIAAGVTAGLSLVIAKQWFDRREASGGAERKFLGWRGSVKTASAPEANAQPDTAVSSEPATEAATQDKSGGERVEEALASGDLAAMETVLQETEDQIDKNRLLNRLVAGHYRLRTEPAHRDAFYRVAQLQVDEALAIMNAVEEAGRPRPDHIEAFKSIAIALEEDERYDDAVTVCVKAMSLGLEDGTKTGFEGRIARLTKQRDTR